MTRVRRCKVSNRGEQRGRSCVRLLIWCCIPLFLFSFALLLLLALVPHPALNSSHTQLGPRPIPHSTHRTPHLFIIYHPPPRTLSFPAPTKTNNEDIAAPRHTSIDGHHIHFAADARTHTVLLPNHNTIIITLLPHHASPLTAAGYTWAHRPFTSTSQFCSTFRTSLHPV